MICKHRSTKSNRSKYCYLSLTIQLKSFVYTLLNNQTFQFSISHLFAHSLNVRQFYLTLSDATTQGLSGPGSDGNEGVLRFLHSPKLQDLALNSLQGLICHKTQQTKPNQTQSSSITGASPSDYLVSYPGHL